MSMKSARTRVLMLVGSIAYTTALALAPFVLILLAFASLLGQAYGAAGSLVVFLVWVYYSTASLLISYEFATNIIIKDVPDAA